MVINPFSWGFHIIYPVKLKRWNSHGVPGARSKDLRHGRQRLGCALRWPGPDGDGDEFHGVNLDGTCMGNIIALHFIYIYIIGYGKCVDN